MTTWIETESGNLINADAVAEFAIIGPYAIGDREGYYDLYALGVGEVQMCFSLDNLGTKAFRDSHRYLIQHRRYEECDEVLARLKETLRTGGRYFSARA